MKLIEVALPLEAINKASVREGYIYRENPSALHKWWAQGPLAVACAVIFAQLVDDPSSLPGIFPSVRKQEIDGLRGKDAGSLTTCPRNLGQASLLELSIAQTRNLSLLRFVG
jgi:adenine-specific DNA methylase